MKIYLKTDELKDYTKDGPDTYTEQQELFLTGCVEFTYCKCYDFELEFKDSYEYITIYSDNKTKMATYSIARIELLTIDDKIIIENGKRNK